MVIRYDFCVMFASINSRLLERRVTHYLLRNIKDCLTIRLSIQNKTATTTTTTIIIIIIIIIMITTIIIVIIIITIIIISSL